MMELLVPLGLLGLIGILVLILIYVIKPNYQVKHISSTYVWKLSLKYRKRRLPTSRVRNIVLFLCQILILALIALILAMPILQQRGKAREYDVIAVIDSSASMYAGKDGDTRFLRAVDETSDLAEGVFLRGGRVSVILADDEPSYLVRRLTTVRGSELDDALGELRADDHACYYGKADIDGAMKLCEEVLEDNPSAEIYLFTDTDYDYTPEGISVVSVAEEGEWNAAILNARAEIEENYYTLTVEIACYGASRELQLDVNVSGANALSEEEEGSSRKFSKKVMCDAGQPMTVIFRGTAGQDTDDTVFHAIPDSENFYTYKSIDFTIGEDDDFSVDNDFYLYGGLKETIKVQYASTLPNPFFTGTLDVLANEAFDDRYDLQITEVKQNEEYATTGFDFYIFEHQTPEIFPADGVVFLVDPEENYSNEGIGLTVRREVSFGKEKALMSEMMHPITRYLNAGAITVTRYKSIFPNDTYDTLLSVDGAPVLVSKKAEDAQIAVMAFSVHLSTIVENDFFLLMYNIFDYYFPGTLDGNVFEVGEKIALNSRGPQATVRGASGTVPGYEQPITSFPTTLVFDRPGTYSIGTSSYFVSDTAPLEIYVRIPSAESDISKTEYTFNGPYRGATDVLNYNDLLIYLAAALVLLLFAEWWLQGREAK